jgi:Flp pilus assembly protein TadD
VLVRVLISLAAVAAGVWLGLGLHSARLVADAQDIAKTPPALLKPGQGDRALDLFQRGRANTPDTMPQLQQAGLLARLGREREALALVREVVRREPQNADGWVLLSVVARSTDPRLAATAAARARGLNPPVAPEG